MANNLPSGVLATRLRGRYGDPQGLPLKGTVSFTTPPTVVLMDGDLIVARTTTVTLDENGAFDVFLVATDNPHMSPTSWAYQVTEKLTAPTPQVPPFVAPPPPTRTFYILLPYDSDPDGVNLADLAPAQPYTVAYLPVTGPAGPQGPPGAPGAVTQQVFDALAARVTATEAAIVARPTPQSFSQVSAAATWTITHAFPYRPNVSLFDTSGREIGGQVSFPSSTTVSVQFTAPETGSAILR